MTEVAAFVAAYPTLTFIAVACLLWLAISLLVAIALTRAIANADRHCDREQRAGQPVAEGSRGGFRKFHIVGDTDA